MILISFVAFGKWIVLMEIITKMDLLSWQIAEACVKVDNPINFMCENASINKNSNYSACYFILCFI